MPDPLDSLKESVDPTIRRENETFIFDFTNLGVTCELSRVDVGKAEAHGLLFVKTSLPGYDPVVSFDKRLHLTPANGFTSAAKYLASRLDLHALHGVTWESVLERIAGETLIRLRDAGQTTILGTLPPRTSPLYAVPPLALYNERTILYGNGGTGKSTIAMAIALAYRTGLEVAGMRPAESGAVLVLDWEGDAETTDWRLRSLVKGMGYEGEFPHMAYKQCFQPLVEIADAVGREIHEMNYGMVIVDSVTWAVAGSAKDDDAVLPMFNAMRRWKCHVLCIDHVSGEKAKEADRPYGSVFKRNAARLLWNVRAAETQSDDLHVGLYSSKSNFSGKGKPVGFRMSYLAAGVPTMDEEMADEIQIVREDVREQASPTSGTARERILAAIRQEGPMTSGEVAAAVNDAPEGRRISIKTVSNTLTLLVKHRDLVQVVSSGEERQWRLPT